MVDNRHAIEKRQDHAIKWASHNSCSYSPLIINSQRAVDSLHAPTFFLYYLGEGPYDQLLINNFTVHFRTVPYTARGAKTYGEILQLVYEPFGYEYDEIEGKNYRANSILFPLKYKNIECSKVFLDWMDVQIKSNIRVGTKNVPPREIKQNEKNLYLLNGLANYKATYKNDIPGKLPKKFLEPWTESLIDKYIEWYNNSNWGSLPYGGECGLAFCFLLSNTVNILIQRQSLI